MPKKTFLTQPTIKAMKRGHVGTAVDKARQELVVGLFHVTQQEATLVAKDLNKAWKAAVAAVEFKSKRREKEGVATITVMNIFSGEPDERRRGLLDALCKKLNLDYPPVGLTAPPRLPGGRKPKRKKKNQTPT